MILQYISDVVEYIEAFWMHCHVAFGAFECCMLVAVAAANSLFNFLESMVLPIAANLIQGNFGSHIGRIRLFLCHRFRLAQQTLGHIDTEFKLWNHSAFVPNESFLASINSYTGDRIPILAERTVQFPCVDHGGVESICYQWPIPLFAADTNPIVIHGVVEQVYAAHAVVVRLENLWHFDSFHFSCLPVPAFHTVHGLDRFVVRCDCHDGVFVPTNHHNFIVLVECEIHRTTVWLVFRRCHLVHPRRRRHPNHCHRRTDRVCFGCNRCIHTQLRPHLQLLQA